MKNNLEVEQWVRDITFRMNRGLPIQIVKIMGGLVQVWYPKGEDEVATEEFLSINDIVACD